MDEMRSLAILGWCVAILVFTCTASFHDFIHYGVLRFRWESQPVFSDFPSPLPSPLGRSFLLQKIGHLLVFQILTFLLVLKFRSHLLILILATTFAALTEVLQLYFTRGGRAFDVGFDLIGVLIALGIVSLLRLNQSQPSHFDNRRL